MYINIERQKNKQGRVYLYRVIGVYDKYTNKVKKTRELIGRVDELEKLYDNPYEHFKNILLKESKELKEQNRQRLSLTTTDILTIKDKLKDNSSLISNLGCIFITKLYHSLEFEYLFNKIKYEEKTKLPLSKILQFLINQRIITIETYTKIGDVYYFEYSIDKAWMLENKKADKAVKEIFGYKDKTGIVPILPYVVFINDSTFEPEINKVTPKLFNALDNVWSVLSLDAFWSAPWLFANNTKNNILQIKHGLANLKERVISTNQVLDQFSQSPINLVQGNSQASSLIQSSNYLVNLIKKFAFMKQDTSSMGTKNIHSAEAQEINSDFESAITSKANLRELQLLEFFNSFYKELNVAIVVVNSSTQWLLTEAKKYSVNLNGSLINQAALQQEIANDNDINEDTNGVENGINKS